MFQIPILHMLFYLGVLILAVALIALVVWIVFPRKKIPRPKFERGNPPSVWKGNERRARDQR
jgi:hypothetical protein